MAELTFVGAAGTVTGSKHLVSVDGQHAFVDCGLFQGRREIEALNHAPLPVAPNELNAVAITHGHLDHVGYLPKLVRDGFRGTIHCTPATADVMAIVLKDAASLQRHMHDCGFHRERCHGLAPFFSEDDVRGALARVKTVDVEREFALCGGTARYLKAGHIVGAAYLELRFDGKRAVFSGDLGRYGTPLLEDPQPLDPADTLVCEATYGDRNHPPDPLPELENALVEGIERGGPIVIPSFAVERTQDMLFAIGALQRSNERIAPIPVHLDSPMAIQVDAVFARHPEAHKPFPENPNAPFGCRNLTLHVSSAESKQLNELKGPAIVIASSGMATGGRILFYLHRHLPNPQATVIFSGYQVNGTLGAAIVNGASPIRIFGDSLMVNAKIVHLAGFSAHAGQEELLRWIGTMQSNRTRVYLVHAESGPAETLAAILRERMGLDATVAQRGMTVTL